MRTEALLMPSYASRANRRGGGGGGDDFGLNEVRYLKLQVLLEGL